MVTATVNLDEVLSYRGAISSAQDQASSAPPYPTVDVDFNICHDEERAAQMLPTAPMGAPRYHVPEEEIALGAHQLVRAACLAWGYACRYKSLRHGK